MVDSTMLAATGQRLLFLGVGTQNWSLDTYRQAAHAVASMGFDAVLLKVADGTDYWYGGLDGYHQRKDIFTSEHLHTIPYTYNYGPKFGALAQEIQILRTYMISEGVVCADMESEMNGQVASAQSICAAIRGLPGLFFVSTWADPQLQNWNGVVTALAPCTDAFLPQIYSNNLVGLFDQSILPPYQNIPTYNLSPTSFGPNDPVAAAKHFASRYPIFALWHYGLALANPDLTAQVLAAVPRLGGPVINASMTQALIDQWNASPLTPVPPRDTGIYTTWVQARVQKNVMLGPPLCAEYDTGTWDVPPIKIIAQDFAGGRIEWNPAGNPNARIFTHTGEITL